MDMIDKGYLFKMIMFEPQFELCGDIKQDVHTVLKAIEECPTIEAEPIRHGTWIRKDEMSRTPFARNYRCSECGADPIGISHYCPDCGAKMDGKETE